LYRSCGLEMDLSLKSVHFSLVDDENFLKEARLHAQILTISEICRTLLMFMWPISVESIFEILQD
jgi:hypothetical protein